MAVDLSNLTDEMYFGEMKLMFNTPGWQILMAELEDKAYHINDLQVCKTHDDMRFRQGQLDTIGVMLNLEDTLKRAEEEGDLEKILTEQEAE